MAYVGTARNLGNDQNTMRSIVLGEAAGQGLAGQQAVANVIYNRAAINQAYPGTFPGGDTAVGVATAPHQFQGQVDLSHYSAAQIAVTDQAIANAQGGLDNTGGATYYANPGASSASWARNLNSDNSVKIGAHYFTDNTDGLVFKGNNPNDGDAVPTKTVETDTQPTLTPASTDGTIVSTDATNPDGTSNVLADPNASNPLGGVGGVGGLISQIPVVGPMLSSMLGGSGSSVTKANPSSTPVAIATGADEQAQASQANTKLATDTANSIYGLSFGTLSDGAMRVALVILGLVLLAGALYLTGTDEGQSLVKKAARTVA